MPRGADRSFIHRHDTDYETWKVLSCLTVIFNTLRAYYIQLRVYIVIKQRTRCNLKYTCLLLLFLTRLHAAFAWAKHFDTNECDTELVIKKKVEWIMMKILRFVNRTVTFLCHYRNRQILKKHGVHINYNAKVCCNYACIHKILISRLEYAVYTCFIFGTIYRLMYGLTSLTNGVMLRGLSGVTRSQNYWRIISRVINSLSTFICISHPTKNPSVAHFAIVVLRLLTYNKSFLHFFDSSMQILRKI